MSEENWRESLPEPFREAPYFKDAESPEAALQAVQNAAAWQGNSLRIPGPDASDEDKAVFMEKAVERIPGLMPVPTEDSVGDMVFRKIGKPENAEGYKVPEIEDFELAGERAGELKAFAHENNYTQGQFEAMVRRDAELTKSQSEQVMNSLKEEQTLLSQEWGAATEERMGDIVAFLANDKTAPPALREAAQKGEITAEYARWLHGLVERVSEPGELARQPEGERKLPPSEALEQFHEITARLIKMQPGDPEYSMLKDKRMVLAEQAFV